MILFSHDSALGTWLKGHEDGRASDVEVSDVLPLGDSQSSIYQEMNAADSDCADQGENYGVDAASALKFDLHAEVGAWVHRRVVSQFALKKLDVRARSVDWRKHVVEVIRIERKYERVLERGHALLNSHSSLHFVSKTSCDAQVAVARTADLSFRQGPVGIYAFWISDEAITERPRCLKMFDRDGPGLVQHRYENERELVPRQIFDEVRPNV